MNKHNIGSLLRALLTVLTWCTVTAIPICLGLLFKGSISMSRQVFVWCGIVLTTCLALSILIAPIAQRYVTQNTRLMMSPDAGLLKKAYTNAYVAFVIIIAYMVLVLLAALLGLFAFAMGGIRFSLILPIFAYVTFCFSCRLYSSKYVSKDALPQKDFQKLYELTAQAARRAEYTGRITMYYDSYTDVFIGQHETMISLTPSDVALFTEDEFFSTMLDRFLQAMCFNKLHTFKLTDLLLFISGYKACFSCAVGGFTKTPTSIIAPLISSYKVASSKIALSEVNTEKLSNLGGNAQALINATAKTSAFSLFMQIPCKDIFEMYEGTRPCTNYVSRCINAYYRALEKNENDWRKIFSHQIPQRFMATDTLRERMTALDIKDYDLHTMPTAGAYYDDAQGYINFCNNVMYVYLKKDYAAQRRKQYLWRNSIITAYKDAQSTTRAISRDFKIDAAAAYVGYDNDAALEILDSILSIDPRDPNANLIKGEVFFYRYSPACITCFEIAAECSNNSSIVNRAVYMLNEYAHLMGRTDLIAEILGVCNL